MKTLQSIVPELNNSQLTLIWREIEGLLPKPLPTRKSQRYDDSYGYNRATENITKALKQFIGGQNE